jgi:hypothetical protein
MIIDCGSCAVAGPACDDCVVSVLLGIPEVPLRSTDLPLGSTDLPLGSTDLPDDHAAAVAVLAESGLVPPLRLVRDVRAS